MGIPGHLLDCSVSAGAGGVFGLVGNIATKALDYLETRRAFSAKQAEWAHETELLKLQAEWPQPETESVLAPIAPRCAWSPSPANGGGAWVEAARALVRPVLTLGLSAVLAAAFFSMAANDAARASVIDSLMFMAVTAIVWWFGDRMPSGKR